MTRIGGINMMCGLKRCRYSAILSIFLVVTALIAGTVGCGPTAQYELTVSSTEGGKVIAPGEGTFTYGQRTAVDLVAEANEGYRFFSWTGDVGVIADVKDATITVTVSDNYYVTASFCPRAAPDGLSGAQVDAGGLNTLGLKSDGTVVAVGLNENGQCNVGSWTDVVQVATGWAFTLGLKSDGTVVATGNNWWGQCDVGSWADIVQVAAGQDHTVGLKSDGTVVAVGNNGAG